LKTLQSDPDAQKMNALYDRSQETQDICGKLVIMRNNTSTEERVQLGKIFNLNSNHISRQIINNGN
jgi:hypothetical protein